MEQLDQHQADGLLVVDLGVHIQVLYYLERVVAAAQVVMKIPLVVMELLTLVAVEVVLVVVQVTLLAAQVVPASLL
jgi:intracellular septation protein A